MSDTTVKKVSKSSSPEGDMGQTYLVSGVKQAMRYWQENPSEAKPEVSREYETVGYVIRGQAELHLEGQVVHLEPGDSWLVPEGAKHTYKILETLAVESTSPPARMDDRDGA